MVYTDQLKDRLSNTGSNRESGQNVRGIIHYTVLAASQPAEMNSNLIGMYIRMYEFNAQEDNWCTGGASCTRRVWTIVLIHDSHTSESLFGHTEPE